MRITAVCADCLKGAVFASDAAPDAVSCPKCGGRREVTLTESVRERNVVDRCVLCGSGHLYIEKDFNGYVGFGILLLAVVGSFVAWPYSWEVSTGILGVAALADMVVWKASRDRTICYRCQAAYRGADANPAHKPYDLGTAGRFADDYDEQQGRHQG